MDTINESYPSSKVNTAPTSPPNFHKNENQSNEHGNNGPKIISKNATAILLSNGKYASIIPTLDNIESINNNNNHIDNNSNNNYHSKDDKNNIQDDDFLSKNISMNIDKNNDNYTITEDLTLSYDDYDNKSVTYTTAETQVHYEEEPIDLPPKYLHTTTNSTYDTLESVPKSPILGRSRSFSTGTGTGGVNNVFDSSVSSSSTGFFSSLFATPSKHYRKRYGGDNDDDRFAQCRKENMLYRVGDEDYLTKHDNSHNNSSYTNSHFFPERIIRKSEKENERKIQKEKFRFQEKERERKKKREKEEQYENDQNDDENNHNNNNSNVIKSRLCLQISVKSSSKYRLCDSNPQEEGDSNWAIITGIYQQSFILRGDDCDFEDKLVSSDGLVNITVDRDRR